MSARAVAYREPWRLLADELVLALVFAELVGPALALGAQPLRQLLDREPAGPADGVLLQGVVHELVLVHVVDHALPGLTQLLEVAEHVEAVLLLGELEVGVDGQVHAGAAGAVAAVHDARPVLVGLALRRHHHAHPPPELEDRVGERAGVAGPLGVVELEQRALLHDLLGGRRHALALVERVLARGRLHPVVPHHPQRPDVEVGQLLLPQHRHLQVAVALRVVGRGRPVLQAHDLDEVERLREHDDARRPLLPHHAPEVHDRVLGRTLGDDVGVRLQHAVYVGGIDVVRSGAGLGRVQHHSIVVIWHALEGLVLLPVHSLVRVPARVDLHLGRRLEFDSEQYCKLPPLVAQLLESGHRYRVGRNRGQDAVLLR